MQTSLPLNTTVRPDDRPGAARLLAYALLEPSRLARHIRRGEASLFAPVVLLAVATAILLAWYYTRLDYGWFSQHLRASNPIVARYASPGSLHLTAAKLLGPAVASAALGVFAAWLVTGTYLWLAAKVARDDTGWRQWLALASWSSVPGLVVLPLAAMTIALHGDGHIAPDEIDPTTLAALLGIAAGTTAHAAAVKVGLAGVWSSIVLAIGVHRWTHLGYPRSIGIVVAPQLALLGLALLPSLFR